MGIRSVLAKGSALIGDSLDRITHPGHAAFGSVKRRIDAVEGLLVPGQEEWLFRTAKSLPDGARIVEIGCFKGKSTVSLSFGCKGTRKHVFSIDRFGGVYQDVKDREYLESTFEKGFFEEWKANVEGNGLSEYVTPLIGDSRDIARIWAAPIHLLFIDGSHLFEDVMADFENFSRHVIAGGIIALHDVTPNWEGPYRAWNDHIRDRLSVTGVISKSLAYGTKV